MTSLVSAVFAISGPRFFRIDNIKKAGGPNPPADQCAVVRKSLSGRAGADQANKSSLVGWLACGALFGRDCAVPGNLNFVFGIEDIQHGDVPFDARVFILAFAINRDIGFPEAIEKI